METPALAHAGGQEPIGPLPLEVARKLKMLLCRSGAVGLPPHPEVRMLPNFDRARQDQVLATIERAVIAMTRAKARRDGRLP